MCDSFAFEVKFVASESQLVDLKFVFLYAVIVCVEVGENKRRK